MSIEPEPRKMKFSLRRSEMCRRSFAPKGAKKIQQNHSAMNISPRRGEGSGATQTVSLRDVTLMISCAARWSPRYFFSFFQQAESHDIEGG